MTDTKLPAPTTTESIAGHLGSDIAATLLAAFAGTPMAALLPVLTTTLASGRHKARVESTIAEISDILDRHEKQLKNVSDPQYKIINEMILAVFQTTEQEKLSYLRNVLSNAISADELTAQEADFISRVVRDMSAKEAEFLVDSFKYARIQLANLEGENPNENTMTVNPESDDGMIVTGLISLGLLIPAEPTWDESGLIRWSSIAKPIIGLLGGGSSF